MNGTITSNNASRVQYLNIVVSESGIREMNENRCVVFMPREKIVRLEIKQGLQAERPLGQVIAGLILVILGILGITMLGTPLILWGAGFLFFGALGAWLLWESLRRGYYLRVVCQADARKLAILGSIENAGFFQFVQDTTQLGYRIRDSSNDN